MKTTKNDPFFDSFVEPGFYRGKTEEDINEFHLERMIRVMDFFKFHPQTASGFHTKQDHIENRDVYLSGIPGKEFTTTGTTGKPFTFSCNNKPLIKISRYIKHKILSTYKIDYANSFIIFVCPFRFLEYDFYQNSEKEVVIRDRYLKTFIEENEKLFKEKEVVLLAANSILHKIKNEGINGDFSLCISCLDRCVDRLSLSSFFGCPVCDWIRGSDGAFSSWSCPEGLYHIDFEVCGIREKWGKLILTDYSNCCESFTNYSNGDLGVVSSRNKNHCRCGVPGKIMVDFFGRETEIFKVGERKIYGMEIYVTLFPGLGFEESVLVQKRNGEIVFYVYGGSDKDSVVSKERLEYLFGDCAQVEPKDKRFFLEFQIGAKKKKIVKEV